MANLGYSLSLMTPVLDGMGFVRDLTPVAKGWKRSIRSEGGFYQGIFRMDGTAAELVQPFNTWLGYHVRERSGGGRSWEGLVYEVELAHQGVVRRRSLNDLANRVRVRYTDTMGNEEVTATASETLSQGRFGIKDAVLSLEKATASQAEGLRDRYLAEHAWPWARTIAVAPAEVTSLTVTVCGYCWTAGWQVATQVTEDNAGAVGPWGHDGGPPPIGFFNLGLDMTAWQSVAAPARYSVWVECDAENEAFWGYCGALDAAYGGGATRRLLIYTDQALTVPGYTNWNAAWAESRARFRGPVSEWITDLVTNDCQFLALGSIDANYLQVNRILDEETPAWTAIEIALSSGDTAGAPWRAWVDLDRKLNYGQIDTAPRYYLRRGGLYDTAGSRMESNPWQVRPAVARDLSYPVRQAESGSWLTDSRDVYIEEVEVDAEGTLTLKTADSESEADLLAEYLKYLAEMGLTPGTVAPPWPKGRPRV